MNKDTNWGLIKRWLDGDRSDEAQRQMERWLSEDPSNEALLEELEGRWKEQASEEFDSAKSFAQVKEQIASADSRPVTRTLYPIRKKSQWLRVAATFALIATVGFMAFWLLPSDPAEIVPQYVVNQTTSGQTARLGLPDGSVVYLNAGSTLKYSEDFGKDFREVILEGEAFFEVVRDTLRPFLVKTEPVTTRVLGTSFNVRAYDHAEVTVRTGKVGVSLAGNDDSVYLTPGQQALYNASIGALEKREVNAGIYTSWKEEVLVFNEFSLSDAAIMLERKYSVTIDINNKALADCVMVGEHENQSLEEILLSMQYVLDFEYEFTGSNTVKITGEGCKE